VCCHVLTVSRWVCCHVLTVSQWVCCHVLTVSLNAMYVKFRPYKAMSSFRRLVVELSPRRTKFDHNPAHVELCGGRSCTGIVFSPSTSVLPCQYHSAIAPRSYLSTCLSYVKETSQKQRCLSYR
jgi:hypothetical protein